MIKKILRSALGKLGFEVRRIGPERLGYEIEEEALAAAAKVRPYTMLSPERLITLYQQAVHCETANVPGDFVECGVWKGGSVALMALANLKRGKARRRIQLFDAFSEICEPDAKVDGERALQETAQLSPGAGTSGKLKALTGFYDTMGGPGTLEGNKDLLERVVGYDGRFLEFHKGWFQDTLPKDAPSMGPIALLRLDGDWYASTKVCLDFLYDKVVKGGFVIIDDYGTYEGCRKAVDEFRAARGITDFLSHIDQTGRYWIKS
jgi:hypothetical protein